MGGVRIIKKRIVAYVRVSTGSDSQIHSFDFQEHYWQDRFNADPDYELIDIYADKGISGRSIEKRPQFQRMLKDAKEKRFDAIITKSVSRFARNTVELLKSVRALREIGVEVIFENENIHTFDPPSELYLTIAATIAENDLEVDSERQRWSIRNRCEKGWVSVGNGILGYRLTKSNELVIVPEEAAIIRFIFDRYIEGAGAGTIAKELNDAGLVTAGGKEFGITTIFGILTNEKYMGDCLMGKKVKINGELRMNTDGRYADQYYTENHHEPIISKERFSQVQQLLRARGNAKLLGHPKSSFDFSGLIYCAKCGAHFTHKINHSGDKYQGTQWSCHTWLRRGKKACDVGSIKESVLHDKFVEAYNDFVRERPQGEAVQNIQIKIKQLQQEEKSLSDLLSRRLITREAYFEEHDRVRAGIRDLRAKIEELTEKSVGESEYTLITEYNPQKVERFISKVIVDRATVTFRFFNGVDITKEYSNGKPGRKKEV